MSERAQPITPLRVLGPEESYFTGKLEAYLHFKEIPFERVPKAPDRELQQRTGVRQVPAVELADGRWMTDTTPIIAWLETQFPEPSVIPEDPLQAFVSWLVEDYGDEWLWRPAMHYRWSYPQDAHHLSRKLSDEMMSDMALPGSWKRLLTRWRQRTFFVRLDGVNATTWAHVEHTYTNALAQLEAILETRPFLLGARPTIADYGFFGSMFRHFGIDPTASSLMRETAPGVYEWVARVWNARASRTKGPLATGIPEEWGALLDTIGSTYLPYLAANAEAWKRGDKKVDVEVEGVRYEQLRVAPYRVWCLEQLRARYDALLPDAQGEARALLEKHGCWEPLWRTEDLRSGIDPEGRAPFAPGVSMTGLRWIP